MSTNKNMWMVRSEGGDLFEEFKNKKVVALGWNDMGDLSKVNSLDELKELYRASPRGATFGGGITIAYSQLAHY